MKFPFSVLLAMSLIACGEEEPKEEVDPLTVDDDGDGFSEEQGDCDDTNADLSPGATEICDEIDNDCDGDIDDADSSVDLSTGSVFYADADMDGFGSMTEIAACALPEGAVENMDDCDDDNADVNPDATEVCDEIDNDCDAMIDDEDDSLDGSTGTQYWADADGDGEGDADMSMWACSMPEGSVDNMTDCDDTDAALNNADVDADGLTSCADENGVADCDDTGATELTDTTQDGDCDGTLTADDCDDTDAMSTIMADDMDCDGVVTAQDCDDSDVAVGATDVDGDGFIACVDDCDDNDPNLYPGVAFNEADPTLCAADADGDGYANYATLYSVSCFDIEMTDSYGDGWGTYPGQTDPAMIDVYEDGVLVDSYSNEDLDGTTGTEVQTVQHCLDSATTSVEVVWNDPIGVSNYNSEMSFTISDGMSTTSYSGSGSADIVDADGNSWTSGDAFIDIADVNAVEMLTGGSDCDDTDATTFGDDDGDGATYCTTDCDDSDPALNTDDLDGDGFSTCDGDCDDTAGSCDDGVSMTETDCTTASGVWTAGGEAFNPGATEIWYDGVDQNCDGANDYDQDGDGYEVMEFDDGTGNMVAWTGTDCHDTNDYYAPLAMEADPTACYYDSDGDGYGDSTPSSTVTGYGAVAGTDCWDGYGGEFTFPGAAFNDSATECMEDEDGDGYGAIESTISSWSSDEGPVAGTDCDDGDEFTFPAAGFNETGSLALECLTDADGDGYAAGIPASSLYEVAVVTGDCFDVTITDSYGDGCNGTVDMYVDYMLDVNIDGPAVDTVTEQWCATMDGTLQVGWTEASSYNYECGFSINDASGTEVYASSSTISDLVPAAASGGTDSDDEDGTVW